MLAFAKYHYYTVAMALSLLDLNYVPYITQKAIYHTSLIFSDDQQTMLSIGAPFTVRSLGRPVSSRRVVEECISNHVASSEDDDAFFMADFGEITKTYRQWHGFHPLGHLHYTLKCNSEPGILFKLAALGCNFDCASDGDIALVLSLDISPSPIIFAHPVKTPQAIELARRHIVDMVFDVETELLKIAALYSEASLYLRIVADDPMAITRLNAKFGASKSSSIQLLALAQRLGLSVIGVSFRVGSGSPSAQAYIKAVQEAKQVILRGAEYGPCIRVLDIGVGFMIESFHSVASEISQILERDELFRSLRVIAEPGRFLVSSAMTLACQVVGERTCHDVEACQQMLYINDGLYGSFLNLIVERPTIHASLPRHLSHSERNQPKRSYCIWGPTCDSNDIVSHESTFDEEVKIADWIFFEIFGAYTQPALTRFNGVPPTDRVLYIDSETGKDNAVVTGPISMFTNTGKNGLEQWTICKSCHRAHQCVVADCRQSDQNFQ